MTSNSTILKLNKFELGAIFVIFLSILILGIGSIILPEIIWDGFVYPNVWEPVVGDADSGDSPYNPENTVLFAILLFTFVIALSGVLRIYNLPARDDTIIAFIPWVVLAAALRVLEDAEFFIDGTDKLFISPVIHFHLAIWIIVAGIISLLVTKNLQNINDNEIFNQMLNRIRFSVLFLFLIFYLILFEPSLEQHGNLSWFSIPITVILAMLVAWLSPAIPNLSWKPIERMLFSTGNTFCVLAFGFWLQFFIEPWGSYSTQEFWPIPISLGVPIIVIVLLHKYGIKSKIELEHKGLEAGVLEEHWTAAEWEEHKSPEKDEIEKLMSKAMIASPLTLSFTFGQLCDGLATWIGIDFGNYKEKHVLGTKIMEFGSTIIEGEGAWLFLLVKIALTALLIFVFSKTRVEFHQKHLRLLIVLALLAVGMAPGLRNLGRNILGV